MRILRYPQFLMALAQRRVSPRVPVQGLNPELNHNLRANHLATPHHIVISSVLAKHFFLP
jgi:hypothetical protein